MQSAPTMLHVRMSSTTAVLDGQSVPMLRLIERVGAGWGKSRVNALCLWPGAQAWAAGVSVGDSLQTVLHDLHAQGGDMVGSIKDEPVLLPKRAPVKREQLPNKEQCAAPHGAA